MAGSTDYQAARKRVEAAWRDAECRFVTVDFDDLRLLLSVPPVTVEEVARVIDPDAWEPFSTWPIFDLARDRRASIKAAERIIALFHTEWKT